MITISKRPCALCDRPSAAFVTHRRVLKEGRTTVGYRIQELCGISSLASGVESLRWGRVLWPLPEPLAVENADQGSDDLYEADGEDLIREERGDDAFDLDRCVVEAINNILLHGELRGQSWRN